HPWSPSTWFRVATGSFPQWRNSWSTTSPTGSPAALTSTAPSCGIFLAAVGKRAISFGGSRVDRKAGTGSWT
ncbi:unnamed protein product, partial [Musa textilis]